MPATPASDPRVGTSGESENGVAPLVALPRGGPSWIVIAIGMAILGVLLFSVLDARRRSMSVPAVRPSAADREMAGSAGPPPLVVPQPLPEPAPVLAPAPVVEAPRPAPQSLPQPQPQIVYVPQPAPAPEPVVTAPPRTSADPVLVFDQSGGAPAPAPGDAETILPNQNATAIAGTRVRAGVLANRAATVPQGTLIPAVLETGLDSTRPGLARAMVTRDVRGFDGTQILIPRGSRLIGEYASQTAPGQNRALVNWTRLIRPDGVTIAIGSPAGDPLGRGGIRANVNSHFFARFAGAILQSALDVGVNLASRSSNSPVIVALPGTVQNSTSQLNQSSQIVPTLTVRPGTSITIFVARDLDFTGAGNRR